MLLPSLTLLGTAVVHVCAVPLAGVRLGGRSWMGVAGLRPARSPSMRSAATVMAVHLLRRDGTVHLHRQPWRLRVDLMRDILRVGVPASLNPVISNGSIAVATAFVGSYGIAALAGYGVAARLEYILVPIAFGFGTALTALVATNMGAGQAQRALRVAWTGAGVVAAITGTIGLAAAWRRRCG